jgi:PAS domain S-box-containing protein
MVNRTKKIQTFVMAAFTIVILMFVSFGGLSLYTIRHLTGITRTIYDHPLRVSNAALSCHLAFDELNALMQKLAAAGPEEARRIMAKIKEKESDAEVHLRIVEDKILGDEGKARSEDIRQSFKSWMEAVGKIGKAACEGEGYVGSVSEIAQAERISADLKAKAWGLNAYARSKADFYMERSENLSRQMFVACLCLLLAGFIAAIAIAWLTVKWIRSWAELFYENEAKFIGAFEHANSGMALVDLDGRFIKVNSRLAEIMGYSVDELERSTVDRITHPEDSCVSREFMEKAVMGMEERTTFEKRYVTKTGDIVIGEVAIALVRDNKGNPLYFVSHMKDVTHAKNTMEALRQSEARYALSQKIGGIGTFEWNIRNRRVYWAEETKTLFGGDTLDFGGDYGSLKERIHPDDYRLFMDAMSECIQEKKELRTDVRIVMPDGTVKTVSVLGHMTLGPLGEPDSMTGVVMDITERKKEEERQHELEKQLTQSQKMESVGRLAGGIAHDFNNILSIILGYTEIMIDDITEDNPHHAILSEVQAASLRARSITRQLLAFGRKQVLEIAVFDVNAVISNFEKLMSRMVGEDVSLNLVLADGRVPVKADSSQLEQVLMNLVVNARDAMPNGGNITIETSVVEIGEDYALDKQDVIPGVYVMIAVSDTGSGIEKENMGKIFEPFFTTKEKDKGSGLGLATVYGIVKQHGGHIWVYSEPDRGTTFKIYLPLAEGTYVPEILEDRPLSRPQKRKITVLVVEDDEALCVLTVRILEKGGYRALAASRPLEAVQIAKDFKGIIDLLITDVIMPDMKGPDVYEKIKAFQPDIRVLYMSGYTENIVTRHGVLEDGVCFIQKPFSKTILLDVVDKLMNI